MQFLEDMVRRLSAELAAHNGKGASDTGTESITDDDGHFHGEDLAAWL